MSTEKSFTDDQLNNAINQFSSMIADELYKVDNRIDDPNKVTELMRNVESYAKDIQELAAEIIIRSIAKHDFMAMAKANYASFIRNRIDSDTLSHLIEDDENGETRSV